MNRKQISATIITIYDPIPNYGNRLQNYAVQETLEKLGIETITVSFEASILSPKNRIKHMLRLMKGSYSKRDRAYWKAYGSKASAFERFNRTYIKTQKIKKIKDIRDSDYFVLGSDQVWNPLWYQSHPLKKYLFLLTFAAPSKKVCFSPSFGVSQLSGQWIPWFKEHLSSFPSPLSVREKEGAEIIKELTGKKADVLMDPTLMLDREAWRVISKKPCRKVDTEVPYVFTYFLGGASSRAMTDINHIAVQKKLKVLHVMNYDNPELYASGPGEFIYLLEHAELILTDSFHGCVFSFLFGKPFLVYSRKDLEIDMMSRINTFLETFDLKRKYADSGIENKLLECDYKTGYQILQSEQKKVIDFLKRSMNL